MPDRAVFGVNAGKEGISSVCSRPTATIERRRVEVGLDNKTTPEIRSGLEKGERVVVGEGAAQRQSSRPRDAARPVLRNDRMNNRSSS